MHVFVGTFIDAQSLVAGPPHTTDPVRATWIDHCHDRPKNRDGQRDSHRCRHWAPPNAEWFTHQPYDRKECSTNCWRGAESKRNPSAQCSQCEVARHAKPDKGGKKREERRHEVNLLRDRTHIQCSAWALARKCYKATVRPAAAESKTASTARTVLRPSRIVTMFEASPRTASRKASCSVLKGSLRLRA